MGSITSSVFSIKQLNCVYLAFPSTKLFLFSVFTMKVSFIVSLAFFLLSNVSANKKLLKQIRSLVEENQDLILEKCGYGTSVDVFAPGFFYMNNLFSSCNLFSSAITWSVTYTTAASPPLCPVYQDEDQGPGTVAHPMDASCVLTGVQISVGTASCNPIITTGYERHCQVNIINGDCEATCA